MNREGGLRTLAEITALLKKHAVEYALITESIRQRLAATGELPNETERHQLFGGMGSLNDVFITRRNGNRVDDEAKANRQLDRLRDRLRRELGTSRKGAEGVQ